MSISFKPTSRPGKWAAGLVTFALSTFLILYVLAELLDVLPATVVTVFGSASVIASLAACVLGLVAVLKHRERAIPVFVAVVVGLIAIFIIVSSLVEDLLL